MLGRRRETLYAALITCICYLVMHLGQSCAFAQSAPLQGMTSKDFIRLMEEANTARGIGVWAPPAVPLPPPAQVLPPAQEQPQSESHSALPTGSGLASAQQLVTNPITLPPAESGLSASPPAPPSVPQVGARIRDNPSVSLSYESVWLRREGDTSTTYSHGGELGTFGEDRSGLVRVGWYLNPMERYEFAYLGSLHWNRLLTSSGPVNGVLRVDPNEPTWLDNVNQALQHDQAHSATLRSYAINHRWVADDLANGFFGFHALDYREAYSLVSHGTSGNARLDLDTSNLLAGVQGGMELWRPLSQRIAVGGQGILGLYGNFANGGLNFQRGDGQFISRSNDAFQIAGALGVDAKVRYQFSSRLQAFGSYRWWYLAGMATIDDQTVPPMGASASLDVSTDAGFLLQGATCGLEIVF